MPTLYPPTALVRTAPVYFRALTDTAAQTLVDAPGAGKALHVCYMQAGNAGSELTTVDFREGTTVKFSFPIGLEGGGATTPLPADWPLPENTALTIIQDNAVQTFVSAQVTVRNAG